jgi:hypothetical protein
MNSKSDEVSLYYGVKFETPIKKIDQLLHSITLLTG